MRWLRFGVDWGFVGWAVSLPVAAFVITLVILESGWIK